MLKVYSNQPSFRTVEFNKTGLSFIVAKQKNPGSNEQGKTYNGVGKSLLVRIVHFCLGARTEDYKTFCEKFPECEFFVDYEINNKKYTAKRATNDPKKIELNNEVISIEKFNENMKSLCFDIPVDITFLSFRSLIPFFIRPKKHSYVLIISPGNPKQIIRHYFIMLFCWDLMSFLRKKNIK